MITLLALLLAAVCYAVKETIDMKYEKSIWAETDANSFFGVDQWKRKYRVKHHNGEMINAPRTWYYRYFNLKYKERFFLSGTLLVFVTDAFHFSQWMMMNFIALAVGTAMAEEIPMILWWALCARVTWWIGFGLFFEHLLVKR